MHRAREPERTCVGCRSKGAKGELVRVVRTPGGDVQVDPSARQAGRGAYVHRTESCVSRATRGGALARALRTPLSAAEAASLLQELRGTLGVTT